MVEGCLTASRSDERGSLLYTAVVAEGALWLGGFAGHAICRIDFPDCAAGQLVPKPESEKDVSNSKPRVEN